MAHWTFDLLQVLLMPPQSVCAVLYIEQLLVPSSLTGCSSLHRAPAGGTIPLLDDAGVGRHQVCPGAHVLHVLLGERREVAPERSRQVTERVTHTRSHAVSGSSADQTVEAAWPPREAFWHQMMINGL